MWGGTGTEPAVAPVTESVTSEKNELNETVNPSSDVGEAQVDTTTEEVKPKLTIKVYNQKSADFILDCDSLVGATFDEIDSYTIYLSDELRVEMEKPDMAWLYSQKFGTLGNASVEIKGRQCIIHIDVYLDPDAEYSDDLKDAYEAFSFTDLNGICRLEYLAEYTREYEYDLFDIMDMQAYQAIADEPEPVDWNAALVGTWEYFETDEYFSSRKNYECFIFYPDGTYVFYRTHGDGLSLAEARSARNEYIREYNDYAKDKTYSFNGETLVTNMRAYNTATAQYENYTVADLYTITLDGDTFVDTSGSKSKTYERISED